MWALHWIGCQRVGRTLITINEVSRSASSGDDLRLPSTAIGQSLRWSEELCKNKFVNSWFEWLMYKSSSILYFCCLPYWTLTLNPAWRLSLLSHYIRYSVPCAFFWFLTYHRWFQIITISRRNYNGEPTVASNSGQIVRDSHQPAPPRYVPHKSSGIHKSHARCWMQHKTDRLHRPQKRRRKTHLILL